MSVAEKAVLITGASRGLGRATAVAMMRSGFHVVCTGRDKSALAETGGLLAAVGSHYALHDLDVTDEVAARDLIDSLPRLDVLVNNAGIAAYGSLLDTDVRTFRRILETNVVGAFVILQAGIRKMLPQGTGTIINIGSDAAVRGIPQMAPYVASKHALLGMTRSARLEFREKGLRIMSVNPGPIDTGILGGSNEKAIAPDQLAETIVHIADLPQSLEIQEILVQPTQLSVPS